MWLAGCASGEQGRTVPQTPKVLTLRDPSTGGGLKPMALQTGGIAQGAAGRGFWLAVGFIKGQRHRVHTALLPSGELQGTQASAHPYMALLQ